MPENPQKAVVTKERCMSDSHCSESVDRRLAETEGEGVNATASDTVGDRGTRPRGLQRGFQFQCRDERAGDITISGNGD